MRAPCARPGASAGARGAIAAAAVILALPAAGGALGAQAPIAGVHHSAQAAASAITTLPEHTPLNPFVASRSGLRVQPLLPPVAGWPLSAIVEYGSAVERNLNFPDSYLFDAELVRARLQLRHDFSPRWFGAVEWGVAGAQAGVADRLFEQYHELIHFTMEERDTRPRDSYGDRLFVGREGIARVRQAQGPRPTDARLGVGLRGGWSSGSQRPPVLSQTMLSVTVPTAPASSLYSRGVASVSLLQTLHATPTSRLVLEAVGGVGFTPTHGLLAPVQRTSFVLGSGAARLRLRGSHAVFATLYGQSPIYRDTGFPELDAADVGVDFGYLWRSPGGRQWRVGLTEDIRRRDPGVDLILKIGTTR
ncbi:MAG: hypothetical protein ACYC2G_04760 [Gemmatimonadaceae bacterium]